MLKHQLSRCIQISQEILALASHASSTPRYIAPSVEDLAAVTAVSNMGIAQLRSPAIPSQLAAALHGLVQSHFQAACLRLRDLPRTVDSLPLRTLALQLRETYIKLYQRRVQDLKLSLRNRSDGPVEKQPFATDILLYAFAQSPAPSKRERHQLAVLTGMTLEQVRVWFQNRRQRLKKRAPELQPRPAPQLPELLARVAAIAAKSAERAEEFEDDDSSSSINPDSGSPIAIFCPRAPTSLTVDVAGPRSYPAPYTRQELSTEFRCDPPVFRRTAALGAPVHAQTTSTVELTRLMSRLTLRHRRQTPRSSTASSTSAASVAKATVKGKKAVSSATSPDGDVHTRKKATRKDAETGRKVAGRRTASAASATSPASSSCTSPPPAPTTPCVTADAPAVPRKRLGPLRRKPAGKALARQASESSVASTSSSDSSRSTSYSSDFSLASDSSFTSVESAPTAATMECFQPQQPMQLDPLAAFDFTQLFSSQPSDPLPQPVADFELPPDLLAGLQMPMDTAALPPPESTDFLALLNDPTIQDLLQSVQDMDVVAPQQTQESLTFNNAFDVGSVDTSAFLDLSASTLPTFDAMFGLDTSSFQDTLWNSPGFSLPITA